MIFVISSFTHYLSLQVGNAKEELLQWHAENMKNNPNILLATDRCGAGIIQAIGYFGLGMNVSPRDFKDFRKCIVEITNPGHEVVKFYLFYERWRRGEVEMVGQHIENLKSVFVSYIWFRFFFLLLNLGNCPLRNDQNLT